MCEEKACMYEGDAVLEDIRPSAEDILDEGEMYSHVKYRGRRPSIIDKTIHFPTIESGVLSMVLRFCSTLMSSGETVAADFLESIPDLNVIELLKTSTFMEIDALSLCLCNLLANRPELWTNMTKLPSIFCEEVFLRASISNLVDNPLITEKWWRIMAMRRFISEAKDSVSTPDRVKSPGLSKWLKEFDDRMESPHVVIRKHLSSMHRSSMEEHEPEKKLLSSSTPFTFHEDIPNGCHIVAPHPTSVKGQSYPGFWKSVFLQNSIQVQCAKSSIMTTDESKDRLAELIRNANTVTELIIRVSTPSIVTHALTYGFLNSSLSSLESLDLSKVGLDASSALALAASLAGNTTLLRLNLGNNKLRNEGALALCRILQTTHLKTLHAEHNALGINAGVTISQALSHNRHLTKLALGYNQLRGRGVAAIANALKQNSILTALDVANCYMGNEGALALADYIKSSCSLSLLRAWDTVLTRNNSAKTRSSSEFSPAPRPPSSDIFAERRKHERDLLYGADTVFSDQWLLIDEHWLSKWRAFVARDSKENPPGPISNDRLIDEGGVPKEGMRKLYDYRGVSRQVYGLFESIYGGGPPIIRQTIDLYAV
ncbi:hypothetical protein GEMRC1_006121 [Eukaryota sp. GEM-RC1]